MHLDRPPEPPDEGDPPTTDNHEMIYDKLCSIIEGTDRDRQCPGDPRSSGAGGEGEGAPGYLRDPDPGGQELPDRPPTQEVPELEISSYEHDGTKSSRASPSLSSQPEQQ